MKKIKPHSWSKPKPNQVMDNKEMEQGQKVSFFVERDRTFYSQERSGERVMSCITLIWYKSKSTVISTFVVPDHVMNQVSCIINTQRKVTYQPLWVLSILVVIMHFINLPSETTNSKICDQSYWVIGMQYLHTVFKTYYQSCKNTMSAGGIGPAAYGSVAGEGFQLLGDPVVWGQLGVQNTGSSGWSPYRSCWLWLPSDIVCCLHPWPYGLGNDESVFHSSGILGWPDLGSDRGSLWILLPGTGPLAWWSTGTAEKANHHFAGLIRHLWAILGIICDLEGLVITLQHCCWTWNSMFSYKVKQVKGIHSQEFSLACRPCKFEATLPGCTW